MTRLFVGRMKAEGDGFDVEYLIRVYEEGATIAYRLYGEDRWGPEAELEERDAR